MSVSFTDETRTVDALTAMSAHTKICTHTLAPMSTVLNTSVAVPTSDCLRQPPVSGLRRRRDIPLLLWRGGDVGASSPTMARGRRREDAALDGTDRCPSLRVATRRRLRAYTLERRTIVRHLSFVAFVIFLELFNIPCRI